MSKSALSPSTLPVADEDDQQDLLRAIDEGLDQLDRGEVVDGATAIHRLLAESERRHPDLR